MENIRQFGEAFLQSFIDKIKIGGRDIAESIMEVLDFAPITTLVLPGGVAIPITKAIINLFITILLCPILFFLLAGKREMKPKRIQSLVETLLAMLNRLCRQSGLSAAQTAQFAPFAATLFMFILVSNLLAVFSLESAATNPAFPIAMAFFDIVCVIAWGIHFVGVKGFLRSLISPMGFMLPFNLLDYVIKPVSLAFRLFGNIFGASILLAFLKAVLPLIIPQLFGLWFEIGDGIIQALVFMYLSISYVGEIVEKSEQRETSRERLTQERENEGSALQSKSA